MSATARQAQDDRGQAERLGIKPGQIVQELGYDTDCDEQLRQAIAVPLDVMRACAQAVALADVIRELGNASARSDADVGIELLRAGLHGARQNVAINLDGVKDATYVQRVREEVERF